MVSVLVGLFGGCAAIFNMRRGFHFDNDELFASDTSKNTTISDVIKDSFDSIEVDGPINVVYKIGPDSKYTVQAGALTASAFDVQVESGRLKLGFKSKMKHGSADVELWGPQPKAIALNGSGDFKVEDLSKGDLEVSIAGSGNVEAAGLLDSVSIDIAGSGDFNAQELKTKSATSSTAGSGNVRLGVTDILSVTILGSGNVSYSGSPKVTSKIVGSGEINRED